MIPCNYCTNPEPVAQIMKYKVSRALHAVTSYYQSFLLGVGKLCHVTAPSRLSDNAQIRRFTVLQLDVWLT